MNAALALSSLCFVAGGLVLAYAYAFRRPSLAARLARSQGAGSQGSLGSPFLPAELPSLPAFDGPVTPTGSEAPAICPGTAVPA